MSVPHLKPIHPALALILGAACTIPSSSARADSPRNYLTVEGRVMNHVGRPVHEAWVFCLGSRRASARVDTGGWYRLEIPGATLEELQRTTLKIRIQARKSGWRFALSSGAPELGLEMRVVSEEAKLARLRVRSNDSTAVEAVANSVVLDANPRALLLATFVGSEGPMLDTPPAPLDVTQEITLAGTAPSIPELGANEGLSLPVTPSGTATAASRSATEPVASSDPVVQSQTPTDSHASPPPSSPQPAGTLKKPKTVRPAEGGGSSSGPRVVRPAMEPDPKASAAGASGAPTTPTSTVSSTSSSAPSNPPSSAPSSGKPTTSSSTVSSTTSGAASGDKPTTTSGSKPSTPSSGKSSASPSAPPKGAAAGTSSRTPGAPAPPSASSGTSRDTSRTIHGQTLAKDAALEADRSLQRVYSRFDPMVSVESKQPTTRAQESVGRGVESGAPGKSGEPCDCVIRGTVEVQSEYPLRGRTEVVIAVEDSPQVTSNVELFMGSPRAFEIRRAPCGVHRLRLYTRSKQRFVLTSVEPRVVCREGSKQQIRLIMEPVARWGISR